MSPESRVSVLKDLITVYSGSGKCIIFTETKRECDAVCAAIAAVHPCEVRLRCSMLLITECAQMLSRELMGFWLRYQENAVHLARRGTLGNSSLLQSCFCRRFCHELDLCATWVLFIGSF